MANPVDTAPIPNLILRTRRLTGDIEPIVSGTNNYVFNDLELFEYIKDAVDYVAIDVDENYYISDTELITPTPTKWVQSLIAMKTALLVREQLSQEGYKDGIYIKDGDTVIDTTRTLQYRGLGQERLMVMYTDACIRYIMNENNGSSINTFDYLDDAENEV